MVLTQSIHLSQTVWRVSPVLHAVQGDTGRFLTMVVDNLPDTAALNTYVGTLSVHRPDGTHANIATSNAGKAFTADITQALTIAGDVFCQLKVTAASGATTKVSTFRFKIAVQEDESLQISE